MSCCTWLYIIEKVHLRVPGGSTAFQFTKEPLENTLSLLYGWLSFNIPTNIPWGTWLTVEHSLSCHKGSFSSIQYNKVCNMAGCCWLSGLWSDVFIELIYTRTSTLQPVLCEPLGGACPVEWGVGTGLTLLIYWDCERIFIIDTTRGKSSCKTSF